MRIPVGPSPSISLPAEPRDALGAAVSLATTEHFTLQTARSTTVAEANSRASGYLAVLSSTVILAFIGNMSGISTALFFVGFLLLPVLAFIGIVTFGRLVQTTDEDIAYARRIAKLRAFYVEVAPELEPFGSWGRVPTVPGLPCDAVRLGLVP